MKIIKNLEVYDVKEEIERLVSEYGRQFSVALLLGKDPGMISRIKNGVSSPPDDVLDQMGLKRVTFYVRKDVEL
jgi:hypothetical protein